MKPLRELDLRGKRLFLRVDFNVPLSGGRVTDRTRIEETIPTVRLAMEAGAKIICASHLGKPRGKVKAELSLAPVAAEFAETLGRPVRFVDDCVGAEAEKAADALEPGEVLLLENLRFHAGEEANDPEFADGLAALADCYCDDAFGAAHRAHASVVGVPGRIAARAAGLLLEKEVRELSKLLEPERPFAAILGGAKISGKIEALEALAKRAVAREILDLCKKEGKIIALPSDFVVAQSPDDAAGARTVGIAKIPPDAMALDVGVKTLEQFERLLSPARTIFWNGPMGVFEKPPFDRGTKALAMLLAESDAFTVVGGGESVAAVKGSGVAGKFTHVSTGGGASLEFIVNGTLPGIEALK